MVTDTIKYILSLAANKHKPGGQDHDQSRHAGSRGHAARRRRGVVTYEPDEGAGGRVKPPERAGTKKIPAPATVSQHYSLGDHDVMVGMGSKRRPMRKPIDVSIGAVYQNRDWMGAGGNVKLSVGHWSPQGTPGRWTLNSARGHIASGSKAGLTWMAQDQAWNIEEQLYE